MLKTCTSRAVTVVAAFLWFVVLTTIAPHALAWVWVGAPWLAGVIMASMSLYNWILSAGVDYDSIAAEQDRQRARVPGSTK